MDLLSLTRRLLSFNTVNPPGREQACAQFIGHLLEKDGFDVCYYEFADQRTSLVARRSGAGKRLPICFTGHLDTVPLGLAKWQAQPFSGETAGDKIFGRGASDMKGGVAAMIAAARRLIETAVPDADLLLVFTAGEETGCTGAKFLAGLQDALTPVGALIVGEPTANYPMLGHKGALWLEAHAHGITAHGSMPDKGVNAIYEMARAVTRLERFKFGVSPHPVMGAPTLNVGTIRGGININSVPDRATIGIDVRTIPGLSSRRVFADLQSCLGQGIETDPVVDAGSVFTDPENAWVQDVYKVMAPFLGQQPLPRTAAYFTDASALISAMGDPPAIILGPGEPDMAHKTDEYCYISKLEAAVEAYVEIAHRWGLGSN